jgi:hypothetical protein
LRDAPIKKGQDRFAGRLTEANATEWKPGAHWTFGRFHQNMPRHRIAMKRAEVEAVVSVG